MTRKRESSTHSAASTPRPSRRIHEERAGKHPELAGCPQCGASYREGRWTWEAPPIGSYDLVCPACVQIQADDAGGELRLEGAFVGAHRSEIEGLLRNVEENEKREHPLKRIISIREDADAVVVRVTDAKLVTQLGHAIDRAYNGELELPHSTSDRSSPARGRWRRD
jgi:hypothetical protein